ncbi:hypothetical protein KO465_01595 [Candidatus Micrarchaeota archaeon]|nr:hypothetical protein [Candidatus Micrarchaeota archaeon]
MITTQPIIKKLEKKESDIDNILSMNRKIIRICAKGIKDVHRRDMIEAKKSIENSKTELKKLKKFGNEYDKYYLCVEQEYTELVVLYNLVSKNKLPSQKQLQVGEISYLNGIMDCVGELRRYMLDSVNKNDIETARKMFEMMQEIYDATLPINFSGAILPNFKQKQDVARRQVESARSELTYAIISKR